MNLNPKEIDVLDRIKRRPELQPFFFRKAKGLKWFDDLENRGFFNPSQNPMPRQSEDEGFWHIPPWLITEYLTKTAPDLSLPENAEYIPKFLNIIRAVSKESKNSKTSNYRTWYQFAKILQYIPPEYLKQGDINNCIFWLEDRFDRYRIAQELSQGLLKRLLSIDTSNARDVAILLLYALTQINWEPRQDKSGKPEAQFCFYNRYAKRIFENIAYEVGQKLRGEGVKIFQSRLEDILGKTTDDDYSYIWRRAIEEHEQNRGIARAAEVLVVLVRDSLAGFVESDTASTSVYLGRMLEQKYILLKRIVIHTVSHQFAILKQLAKNFLLKPYFDQDYRHELWHFLTNNYASLDSDLQANVLAIINSLDTDSEDIKDCTPIQKAYRKLIWLSALKGQGNSEADRLYNYNLQTVGKEPDHPDFSFYIGSGWVAERSPCHKEELLSRDIDSLINLLNSFREEPGWEKPTLSGLAKELRQAVKFKPSYFMPYLNKFIGVDLAFVHELIEAYRELWQESAHDTDFEKRIDWGHLLDFCSAVVSMPNFWDKELNETRDSFVANRSWIVGAIAELIRAGTAKDENAFDPAYLQKARDIIAVLLAKQEGSTFDKTTDAVSLTINSALGKCIEAFICYSLYCARLEDKKTGNHNRAWQELEPAFDAQLLRSAKGQYEFVTIAASWLPNLLYLNDRWLIAHLPEIFSSNDSLQRLCAIQGYSYVDTIYREIYHFLRDNGHLLWAIQSKDLKEEIRNRIIQNVVIAYLDSLDILGNSTSLMEQLIERNVFEEYSEIIWFIWTLKDGESDISRMVINLWERLDSKIDDKSREGKVLLSKLCTWSVFVDEISGPAKNLLIHAASFAEDDYNGDELIQSLHRLVGNYPNEVANIYLKMLVRSHPTHDETHIKDILKVLWLNGGDQRQAAKTIADKYIENGVDFPGLYLLELK